MGQEIGGYFELQVDSKNNYLYPNLFHLNSGRNCLEYILTKRMYSKVYLPYFTCDAILQPILKLGLEYEFFDVNDKLEAIFDYSRLQLNEVVILTNYFGLKDKYIQSICEKIKNVIVDNAQALFAKPIDGIDTFYSPRKFVGVADGGILSTKLDLNDNLEQSTSYNRMFHLLKRIDLSAQEAYADFQRAEKIIGTETIMKMSNLTKRILYSIDYKSIEIQRIENFNFLHKHLKSSNQLELINCSEEVPLVYPYKVKDSVIIRDILLKNKIFCAKYWPNVLEWCNASQNSYFLTDGILALPIDQRYNIENMLKIVKIIKNGYSFY